MIENDTICAISTPAGIGGIAVIRVSGPQSVEIVNSLWEGADLMSAKSHTAHLGELIDPANGGEVVDECVATLFRAPKSYTGEDVVEIAVHGSRWVQREALALLQRNGCRMAMAGEYTRRAVMNGRMDLSQAEGVADVIASTSRAAHRIAVSQMKGGISKKLTALREQLLQLAVYLELELDFSEEDVEFADRRRLIDTAEDIRGELSRLYRSFSKGNAIKEGIPVAIVGATNAGKSSLLNAMLEDDRAIVSDVHGTTRDTIEETLEIGDYLFRFIDTAGLRDTSDPIEQIGIDRSRKAMSRAKIVIAVIDASLPGVIDTIKSGNIASLLPKELTTCTYDENHPDIIIALNKTDKLSDTSESILTPLISHLPGPSQRPKPEADNLDPTSVEPVPGHAHVIDGMDMKPMSDGDEHVSHELAIIPISVLAGDGLEKLRDVIRDMASNGDTSETKDGIMITNLRQAEALRQALNSIRPLIEGLRTGLETDLVAQHLRETLAHLSSITGEIPSTEILNTIFSSFCIGK